jgi:hypothetical protein
MQWSKDIRRNDKKRSRKYYIDNEQLSNTNLTNNSSDVKRRILNNSISSVVDGRSILH